MSHPTNLSPQTTRYLNCYSLLHSQTQSKSANKQLLQLQASSDAWIIAYQLMSMKKEEMSVHGGQLMSKKLNNAPKKGEVGLEGLIEFLKGIGRKNAVVWLCIAKTMIHLSPEKAYLPSFLQGSQSLKLLKQIPAALSHINLPPPLSPSTLKPQYLSLALPIFNSQMSQNPQLVLQVIDAFVSYGVKITEPSLVRFLLSLPFEDGGHILEEILGKFWFKQLNMEILGYLQGLRTYERGFGLHIAYLKLADLNQLQFQQFRSALQYILTCLNHQHTSQTSQSTASLSQSYEFWHGIATQLSQNKINQSKQGIIQDAFLTLWNLVCQKSLYTEMPSYKIPESKLAIDLDQEQYGEVMGNQVVSQGNKIVDNFRDYGEDFIVMIVEAMDSSNTALQHIFNVINRLATGPLLHLQLSIFILHSLAPWKSKNQTYIALPLRTIFSRSSQMSQYLCFKTINLIGQLSDLLNVVQDLLMPILFFLGNALMYETLAPVAAENCCNLLEEVKEEENGQGRIGGAMQEFLGYVYEVLFRENAQTKVIENLTRAMAIFIHKFKQPNDYHNYLVVFRQRCENLQAENRSKLIQAAVSGQLWINSREQMKKPQIKNQAQNTTNINPFMSPFAFYLQNQLQFLLQQIDTSFNTSSFSSKIRLLNLCLRTNALGDGNLWSKISDYLLDKYLDKKPTLSIVVTPLINFIRGGIQTKDERIAWNVAVVVGKWNEKITNLLDFGYRKYQFVLTGVVLKYHLNVVMLLKQVPTLSSQLCYDPKVIIQYMVGLLQTKQIWEYQIFKHSLNYFLIALQLGFTPLQILNCILSSFSRLQETLWTSIDPILRYIFRQYGFQIYEQVLNDIGSSLGDRSNPLNQLLREGFQKEEGKTVKNLFLAL